MGALSAELKQVRYFFSAVNIYFIQYYNVSFFALGPIVKLTRKSLTLHYSEQNIDRSGSVVVGKRRYGRGMLNLSDRPQPWL